MKKLLYANRREILSPVFTLTRVMYIWEMGWVRDLRNYASWHHRHFAVGFYRLDWHNFGTISHYEYNFHHFVIILQYKLNCHLLNMQPMFLVRDLCYGQIWVTKSFICLFIAPFAHITSSVTWGGLRVLVDYCLSIYTCQTMN